MELDYAHEKLSLAANALASGTGTIQERLRSAYSQFMRLKEGDLPPDLEKQYVEIDEQLTKSPARGDEGRLLATTEAMSDEEAREIADTIFWLHVKVSEMYGREHASQDS